MFLWTSHDLCFSSCHVAEVFLLLQVSPYKKIRRVSFIKSIPKSPAGKILRRELVDYALSCGSSKLWSRKEHGENVPRLETIVTCSDATNARYRVKHLAYHVVHRPSPPLRMLVVSTQKSAIILFTHTFQKFNHFNQLPRFPSFYLPK